MALDTFELSSSLMKGVQDREHKAQVNDIKLYREKPIMTSISPLYQRYIGNTVIIAFNGNFRKFPVDGSQFACSKGHYNALQKYIRHIDRQILLQQKQSKFIDQNETGDFKRM